MRANLLWLVFIAAAGSLLAGILAQRPQDRLDPTTAFGAEVKQAEVPGLFIVFQPTTCAPNLSGIRHWNAAHEAGKLRALGIVLNAPEKDHELQQLSAEFGFRFPVVAGNDGPLVRLLRTSGHHTAPVAVLMDTEQRIRVILPARSLATAAALEHALELAR